MSILHTVNKSPFEKPALSSCLQHALPGSFVLLLEDGVYGARAGSAPADQLENARDARDVRVYALGPDLAARGISPDVLASGVEVLDYEGFVDLAVECDKVKAWL